MQRSSKKLLLHSTGLMLMAIIVKTAVYYLRNVFIGRTLGAEIFGTYTLAETLFQLFGTIAIFGLFLTIKRFVPLYLHDKQKLNSVVGTSYKFGLAASLVFVLLVFMFGGLLGVLFSNPNLYSTLSILLLGLPFFVFIRLSVGVTTSFHSVYYNALIENILLPVISSLILIFYVALGLTHSAIPLSLTSGYIITVLVTIKYFQSPIYAALNTALLFKAFDKKIIIYSVPIFINNLFVFITNWADIIFLGYFRNPAEVGIYGIALLLSNFPGFVLISISSLFLPTLTKLIAQNSLAEINALYNYVIKLTLILALPAITIIVIFSRELIMLFGHDFSVSLQVMWVLGLGTFINIVTGPIQTTLIGYDRLKLVTYNTFIATGLSFLLNMFLVPKYGMLGSAIAHTVSTALLYLLALLELMLLEKIRPYSRSILALIILNLLLTVIFIYTKIHFFGSNFDILVALLLGICWYLLYWLVLKLLKILTREEQDITWELLLSLKKHFSLRPKSA